MHCVSELEKTFPRIQNESSVGGVTFPISASCLTVSVSQTATHFNSLKLPISILQAVEYFIPIGCIIDPRGLFSRAIKCFTIKSLF